MPCGAQTGLVMVITGTVTRVYSSHTTDTDPDLAAGGPQAQVRHHAGGRHAAAGAHRQDPDADAADAAGPPRQDIRHALGFRQPQPRVSLAGEVHFYFNDV